MKSIVFFCIALIAMTNASSLLMQHPINFSKDRNVLKAFLHVQEMMESEGPMDAITDYLDDLTNKIKSEQSHNDAVQSKNRADCAEEAAFRKKEIADAVAANETAQAQLANCQGQLRQAKSDLAQNLENQKQQRASLEQLIEARRQANQIYLGRVDDHTKGIAAIDDAIKMLGEIFSGTVNFVQLGQSTRDLFTIAVALRDHQQFAPVLAAFSQIASKKVLADSAALKKVVSLLNKLKNNLQVSLDDYHKIEKEEVAQFEKEKAAIEAEIAALEAAEKKLRAHIAEMKVCIGVQTGIINAAVAKADRNSDLLETAQRMCESAERAYKAATAKRADELELVAKIKEIVMARYKQIADSIRARGMKSVQEWRKYKNKTVYDPAEAFKRARGQLNKEGAAQAGFKKNEKLAAVEVDETQEEEEE